MPINVRTEVVVQANCVAAYTAAACEALEQAVKFGPKAVACVQAGMHTALSQELHPDLIGIAYSVRLFQDAKDPTMFVILETWDAPNVEAIKTAMAMSPGYQACAQWPLTRAPISPHLILTLSCPSSTPDLNKTRPMEAKPTIVRFPTTVAEYGLARVPSTADDKSTLWVALVDTVVVEANDAFEKTARTLLSELAKFPESE